MKVAVLGAGRGLGRAVARRLAARGDALFLLGRHGDQLEASARDLEARGASGPVGTARCDLSEAAGFAAALEAAETGLSGLDAVVVTAGLFAPQRALDEDPDLRRELLEVDFVGTVLFCEEARRRLLERGGGLLCVFSSLAGERGRRSVLLYGAAKAGLTRYLEGLDHAFRRRGLVTVTVLPGFVRTDMTEGLPEPPFAGEPEAVAADVVRAMDRGRPVVTTPHPWWLVRGLVRALPRWVLRRVDV